MTWTPPPPDRQPATQRRRGTAESGRAAGPERAAGSPDAGRSRGQTAQDFAVGIGLFLLAVAFVFALVPEVLAPFEAGATASQAAQADRAATLIVGNLSVSDHRPNELDNDSTNEYFDYYDTVDDEQVALRNETGLPFSARINVEIRELESGDTVDGSWSAGADYREGFDAASATRIVRTDDPDTCAPGCKLLVRVW